jgi:quinone-modifying oxidoreductase subunit QmoC
MQAVGLGLLRARRMNPLEAVGGGHKCNDIQGIHAMLAKARELEARRKAGEQKET